MKSIFLPLTKVDAELRLVYGVAAVEELDRSGEIFDYEKSKPYFEKWSADTEKSTLVATNVFGDAAKSYGNVREMHGKTGGAAGKLSAPLAFDDVNKSIEVCAKVVDDAAWKKVQEGVYTGFSIGGDYVGDPWDDPAVKVGKRAAKRYVADPIEISLVDAPCMPSATYQFIKSAGAAPELRKFAAPPELTIEQLPEATGRALKALSDAPKSSAAHADVARLLKRARTLKSDASGVAKAYVETFGDEFLKAKVAKGLNKSLWTITDVASALSQLNSSRCCLEWEVEYEGADSPAAAKLKELVISLGEMLVMLVQEETSKLVPKEAAKVAAINLEKEISSMENFMKTHSAAIEKISASNDPEVVKMATHLKEIGKHVDGIRKAHNSMGEHLDELDPDDDGGEDGEGIDDNKKDDKAAKSAAAKLTKATDARFDKMELSQKETQSQIANLVDAVSKAFGKMPAASRVAPNPQPIEKENDGVGADKTPVIDPKDPEAAKNAIKNIHAGELFKVKA